MKRIRLFLARVGIRDISQPHVSPPMGLLCLAAYIRRQFAADIEIVDQREVNCPTAELAKRIVDFKPDILGISSVTASSHIITSLSSMIRRSLPDTLIVLGGPHSSASRAAALDGNDADISVPGEGELMLEQIILAWQDDKDYSKIQGLIWRGSDGDTITNPGLVPLRRRFGIPSSAGLRPHRCNEVLATSFLCPRPSSKVHFHHDQPGLSIPV